MGLVSDHYIFNKRKYTCKEEGIQYNVYDLEGQLVLSVSSEYSYIIDIEPENSRNELKGIIGFDNMNLDDVFILVDVY